MKILANKYNINTNIKKDTNFPNFNGKEKIIKSLTKPQATNVALSAVSAIGIANLAINAKKNLHNEEELKDFLLEQKQINLDNNKETLFYNSDDINTILECYKKNPQIVEEMIHMQAKDDTSISPRFNAMEIKSIINESKNAEDLTKQLIREYDRLNNYVYKTSDIINIINLSKAEPEFTKQIVNLKTKHPSEDKNECPRFKTIHEFKIIQKTYKKNSNLTEKLLAIPELTATEIADIAENFNSLDFFEDLRNCSPKEKHFDTNFIKKLHKETLNLKQPIQKLDINSKKNIINFLTNDLSKNAINVYRKNISNFDNKINQIKISLGLFKQTNGIAPKEQVNFIKYILANNNKIAENILKNFDFAKYGKDGIPLKYSRNEFVKKINSMLLNLDINEQNIILNHFGIFKGNDGFDGILLNKPFTNKNVSPKAQEIAENIKNEIELFTAKNKVNTGDKDADTVLSSLIQGLPEFTSVVGKKQHGEHIYSVDIHSLKVLQSAINHPLYNTLSDKSKVALKLSILFHDLGKKGCVVDHGHAILSSIFAETILQKFPFDEDFKNRILNIVENHHWNTGYSWGELEAHDIAALCRHPEDLAIYAIFSKGDFENINKTFHIKHTPNISNQEEFDAYMEERMLPIYKAYDNMASKSNFVFFNKILNNGQKFPKDIRFINNKAVMLKVLNFSNLNPEEKLDKYGFAPNTTKDNIHFLVHATRDLEDTSNLLNNRSNKVAWSTTIVKNGFNNTYYPYGFIFEVAQPNISIAYGKNLKLGTKRDFENFKNMLFLDETVKKDPYIATKYLRYKKLRVYLNNVFRNELISQNYQLSDDEFVKLSKYILNKEYLTQFTNDIQIGDKIIRGSDVAMALKNTRNALYADPTINSEIECFEPIPKALYGCYKSLNEAPVEFIEFALKHNLPIILMPPMETLTNIA
jgi:hypothetical protein